MFVFKLQSGKCILHTGDFRACPDMESEPFFWNNYIDTIYLDTTYLKAQYSFKPQTEAIADVIRYVEEAQQKNTGARILYVCAAYFIGKERVWTRIAEYYDYKVWVDDRRRSALELLGSEEYTKYLEPDPTRANVHVKNSMNYQGLAEYSEQFLGVFDVIVYFDPRGWNFGKTRNYKFTSKINIVSVEYSEHSSCSELERFVKFIQPKKVISTVPVGRDLHITCDIPKSWLAGGLKPMSRNFQLSISNFLHGKNHKSLADPKDLDACLSCDKFF